ncbi:lipocalin-like domain-containing protein [Aureisphaera galaxeae]|uniref:lipocalin-like domain-containing protein n=1 Tax=Aureisphaera galaxeae TaxID=1538023 RepID=UPI0023507728|nr:lipocalin-like domain-containing protein [Aureisphaera galaxeae]MDC8004006.1 lipocalin-like domain-containing protein [Aureisphaera galaxeae]
MKTNTKYIAVCFLFLFACSSRESNDKKIRKRVSGYFETYQERKDFSSFMEYYDDSIVLIDIINGDSIAGKEALSNFFNWHNPSLKGLSDDALIVETQTIEGNRVVTSGYFTEFEWNDTKFEAMDFIIVHVFNDDFKIIEQIDWINYPQNLLTPKNQNDLDTLMEGESESEKQLVGTWKLIELADFDPTSKRWIYPFGKGAQGHFTYTAGNIVTINIFNEIPINTSKDSINKVLFSFEDILLNSAAYFGEYSIDEANGILTHHVKGGAVPWYIDTNQSRPFRLENDTLYIGDMVNWKRILIKVD